MKALQFVDVPGYNALILRRTFGELNLPEALMNRAHEWLAGTEAKWHGMDHRFTFPSTATVTFGFLRYERDKYRYQSAEFQSVNFDELCQFPKSHYQYLFSRLRRLVDVDIPLSMRSAGNPDGDFIDWVKEYFVDQGMMYNRPVIPAFYLDNPHIDQASYEESLDRLDPVTRARLKYGDWEIKAQGNKFKRIWFQKVDHSPKGAARCRYWDLAGTEPKPGKDPDWTAGAKVAEKDGIYYIEHIVRVQDRPYEVEQLIKQIAEEDGKEIDVFMEQEPGSSGINTIDHYTREVLKGYSFRGNKTTGSKELRANPVSSAAAGENVKIIRGEWNSDMLDEFEAFPAGAHDDQVDAVSGAVQMINEHLQRSEGAFMFF